MGRNCFKDTSRRGTKQKAEISWPLTDGLLPPPARGAASSSSASGSAGALLVLVPPVMVPQGQGEDGGLGGLRLTLKNVNVWDTGAGTVV